MNEDNNDDYLVQSIFLLLITVICLGVSWWSMTEGYKSFFGNYGISAAVSTVFVLMLAALNYTLRRGLIKGIGKGSVSAILVIYLLVVMLSFSGMFNKFYSQFIGNDLVREEIDQKKDKLEELEKNATAVLTGEEGYLLITQIPGLKEKFKSEVLSQTELGIGKNARNILTEIQKLLGKTTPFTTPPTPTRAPNELNAVIEKVFKDIDAEVKQSRTLNQLNAAEKLALQQELPKVIKIEVDKLIDVRSKIASKSNESQRIAGLEAIQTSVDAYKKLGAQVKSLVKEKSFIYDRETRIVNDRIGEIPHSYESAKRNLDKGVVWVSALIALGIDLIVPIFVFFLTPRSRVSSQGGFVRRRDRGAGGLKAEH